MSSNAQQSEQGEVNVEQQRQDQVEQVGDNARGDGYVIFGRQLKYDPVSIAFAVLIFIGGLIAFITKQSVYSLVASAIFAILIAAGVYLEGARKIPYPLLLVLAVLSIMMGYRYYQSEKFMPSGLVTLLTLIVFARHAYLVYLRKKQASSGPL